METKIKVPLIHTTFRIDRSFNVPPVRVFAAWGDKELRAKWFIGPGTWEQLERRHDFNVGGKEIVRGRFADGNESLYVATFHVIDPDRCIVFDYDMHYGGTQLSVSLSSIEFEPEGSGTVMKYTEQAAYIDGKDGTESRKSGTGVLFDRLAAILQGN